MEHLKIVLKTLKENQLYAKFNKCELWLREVHFSGHVISLEGTKVDPNKVKPVLEWNQPKNVNVVRNFLGLADY